MNVSLPSAEPISPVPADATAAAPAAAEAASGTGTAPTAAPAKAAAKAPVKAARKAPRKALAKAPVKAAAQPAAKAPLQTPARPAAEPTAKKAAKATKTVPQRSSSSKKSGGKTVPAQPRKAQLPAKKVDKPAKLKEKLVRDSFTMPQKDFGLIAVLKDRALGFKRPTKKSELLRAGLQVLAALPAPALRAALDALDPLKAGRPKRAD